MAWFDFTFSRRCIAVDLGQSRIKAILAERQGGGIEVLHAFTLDLQEEGLLTVEETNRHISRILLEMGDHPVSLVIPQHVALSHMIVLPSDGRKGWVRMIEEETQKLTGLSESAIVYDYFRLKPFHGNRNPVWVTVSREKELEGQIGRLHGSGLAVYEVTNTGNALASAYLATQTPEKKVVLADVGATATTVVVLERLQPIYATVFPLGGELFSEAVASARNVSFDEAETIKKTELLFENESCPEFVGVVERWLQELQKAVGECVKDQPEPEGEPLKVFLSGGSSLQPGFVEYVEKHSWLHFDLWSDSARGVDSQTYAVAYGAALAGLNVAPVSSSLLPKPLRQERFRMVQVAALNVLAALLLAALFIILIGDSAVKRDALAEKQAWIEDLDEAHALTETVDELLAKRNQEYNKIVPIVQQQKRTRDLLRTLTLMQEVRRAHDLWFALLADGQSYLEEGTSVSSDSDRAREPRGGREEEKEPEGWNRFVVEMVIPGDRRQAHETLRKVVERFGSTEVFRTVDTLAAAEEKSIVNEAVILPDQTFSLNLELIRSELPLSAVDREERSLLGRD